ncbi:MAG: Kef-type K+ transport system, membrane component [Solidesulfovibrio magneticus str. Maddingley MBC34]|uniref:Kef-type K+ transport system, membrane component n=1 Tax=Solidesulfovibrio magneticus str. Maddingley MBC34 TaxID=1206767 RepID=K6HBQ4_9BACT|nr:MAG: Kef-type K+ transport system, membrane component [Solidesulfovibrio magneticus str. Maddingley MBC34]
MEIPVLPDVTVVFGLAVVVILVCHRMKVPAIVGMLLTGMLCGPHGLGLVRSAHDVEILSEIGVIMLLFTIGLELSLADLSRLKRPVFIGGSAQMALTWAVFFAVPYYLLDFSGGSSVLIGMLAALSSTAIVLKTLQECAQMEAPHGRVSLGILIFQDLLAVPMMLSVPLLAGRTFGFTNSIVYTVGKGALILVLLVFFAKKIMPRLLLSIVRTRSRELFLMTALAICMAVSLLTASIGLSLSLGAFLAGLLLSGSDYRENLHEAVLPFKDVFTSLFFISIGMLLNVGSASAHLAEVIVAAVLLLVTKAVLAGTAARILGYPTRTAVLVGMALCQVGEFSFILAKTGFDKDVISEHFYQKFLAASILTMVLAPFCITLAPRIAAMVCRWLRVCDAPDELPAAHYSNHLIILGFGAGGRQLARAAKNAEIPYVILEMNPDTVRNEAKKGEPILFGDASKPGVLSHICVQEAKALAVVISDAAASRRAVEIARQENPALYIVARTRFNTEITALLDLGANDVIAEEFEASLGVFTRVMDKFMIPRDDIERMVADIRREGYKSMLPGSFDELAIHVPDKSLAGLHVAVFTVDTASPLAGRSLMDVHLRREHDLTVAAARRGEEFVPNPDGPFVLSAGDRLYVMGTAEALKKGVGLFRGE